MPCHFRRLALAALASASLAAALPARAGDVGWSVTLGAPGFTFSAGQPWAGPRFAPAPVVVAPRPSFVATAPWVGPAFVPGPFLVGPPVVRRAPPRVVVVTPVVRTPRAHPHRVFVPAPVIVAPGPRG